MADLFLGVPGSEYGECIIVEEYKGDWSLVQGRRGEDQVFKKWCFPQTKDRTPTEKALPWKILLGKDKAAAVAMLKGLIELINKVEDDDIPI